MHLNHPKTHTPNRSMEKLSSKKLVPRARKVGNRLFKMVIFFTFLPAHEPLDKISQ